MIDIHSHILPGLDDGARTLAESLQMLELAARSGTTDIVATPHANAEFPYDGIRIQTCFAQLSEAAQGMIRLHLGCDFHLSYENVQDALRHPDRYTVNNFSYLMVELADLVVTESAGNVLMRLREAGMIPVITHPERNVVIQRKLDTLREWVQQGCLVQITGQSLVGRFGPEAERSAHELVRSGLAHFVASDGHDCRDRPPRLDEAHRNIAQRYGAKVADRLCRENPAAVVAGEELPPVEARKWWRFGK